MNLKSIVASVASKKGLFNLVLTAIVLLSPLVSICQITPPAPPSGGGGVDVPFDSNMNLMFLAAGVLFAVIITVRQLRKRTTTTA
jgi:hypothetical protein